MVGLIWAPYLLPLLTLLFQHLFPGSFEWPLQVCFTTCSGPAFARVVISVSGMSGDPLGPSPTSRASQGPACAWTFHCLRAVLTEWWVQPRHVIVEAAVVGTTTMGHISWFSVYENIMVQQTWEVGGRVGKMSGNPAGTVWIFCQL